MPNFVFRSESPSIENTWQHPFGSRPQDGVIADRRRLGRTSRYAWFVLLFALTLPLSNPWIRGDGVGYYAYIHALLIHHDLRFETEWRAGNESFTMGRVDAN